MVVSLSPFSGRRICCGVTLWVKPSDSCMEGGGVGGNVLFFLAMMVTHQMMEAKKLKTFLKIFGAWP